MLLHALLLYTSSCHIYTILYIFYYTTVAHTRGQKKIVVKNNLEKVYNSVYYVHINIHPYKNDRYNNNRRRRLSLLPPPPPPPTKDEIASFDSVQACYYIMFNTRGWRHWAATYLYGCTASSVNIVRQRNNILYYI